MNEAFGLWHRQAIRQFVCILSISETQKSPWGDFLCRLRCPARHPSVRFSFPEQISETFRGCRCAFWSF